MPLAQLVLRFGLGYHQYIDDTQLYLLKDGCPESAPGIMDRALEAMDGWLQQSWLKLNPTKVEVLYLGRGGAELAIKFPTLDGVGLAPSQMVKRLGVVLDAPFCHGSPGCHSGKICLFLSSAD